MPRERRAAFTLLELLVSLTVLSLLMLLVFSMVAKTQETWATAESRVSQFREARNAFEQVTRRVSQAVLGTYWDYEYSSPNARTPTKYDRQSDLHFACGPMKRMMPSGGFPTHGIFFQAPLGYTEEFRGRNFDTLLNSVGYYVKFGSDEDFKPGFVQPISPARNRYRLMEFRPPSEELDVYRSRLSDVGSRQQAYQWFTSNLEKTTGTNGFFSRPIAENIIALILRPKKSKNEDGVPTDIAPNYEYDTREFQYGAVGGARSRHQMPPMIEITMVAVAERSMIRYEQINGGNVPNFAEGLFEGSAKESTFLADLEALKNKLSSADIDFRVFSETVGIRASKWSDENINN